MDFSEKIDALADQAGKIREHVQTEEATKTSLVMPFFQALGYNPFDPREVVPEYTADVGTKKGEKVDYAIMRDNAPIFLVEVKSCGCSLDQGKANQLLRYFNATPSAKVGILTDGIIYKFFSDLDQTNIMDQKPFMVFDFTSPDPTLTGELEKLTNERYDAETALTAAQHLKYTREIKRYFQTQYQTPEDEFVRFVTSKVYSGRITQATMDDFHPRVLQAFKGFISELIAERLHQVMDQENMPAAELQPPIDQAEPEPQPEPKSAIVTTEEEIEAYLIVKSILRESVEPARVVMRDQQSYCGVILDDNNRKPLCRLHFNTKQKYLGTFDTEKIETRHPIDSLNDIFNHAEALIATAKNYDQPASGVVETQPAGQGENTV